MPALLSFHAALTVDILTWALWSTAVGWWAARLPDATFGDDGWLTRIRPWERNGLVYAHVGVRRWKGRLPDLGPLFGGRRLRLARRRDPEVWRTLAEETRRAEWVHWVTLLALPAEAVLRTGVVLAPMAAYAVVANVPCIIAQRHNRARLEVLLDGRRRLSPAGSPHPAPRATPTSRPT